LSSTFLRIHGRSTAGLQQLNGTSEELEGENKTGGV